MKTIQICPECANPGIEVSPKAVYNLVKDNYKNRIKYQKQWYICSNPYCKISYFNDSLSYKVNDIKVKIWFKTNSISAPICYCSNITRKEIRDAVKNGCKTIDEVQKFTKKNITGKCKTMNVLGKCCRNVFLFEMEKYSNEFQTK